MGFRINLQCFENRIFSTFQRSIAWDVFGPFAHMGSAGGWNLRFPEGDGGLLMIDDKEQIDGLSIDRPGVSAVFECLYAVMQKTPTLLYWSSRSAVASPAVIPGILPSLIAALGEPFIAHRGQDIIDCIKGNPPTSSSKTFNANDNIGTRVR